MDLSLMNLKRYAIDNRLEIRFAAPGSGTQYLISDKGLVKIPTHTENTRVEDVLAAAQSFELIGQDKPQKFDRARMAEIVAEAFKKRNFATVKEKEED